MTREEEFQSKVLHKLVKLETYHEFYVSQVDAMKLEHKETKMTAERALSRVEKLDTKVNTIGGVLGGFIALLTALGAFWGNHK